MLVKSIFYLTNIHYHTECRTTSCTLRTPIVCFKNKYHGYSIAEEARNQEFTFQALQHVLEEKRRGIQIPEIYRVIKSESAVHIVMEYIPGKTLHELIEREGR